MTLGKAFSVPLVLLSVRPSVCLSVSDGGVFEDSRLLPLPKPLANYPRVLDNGKRFLLSADMQKDREDMAPTQSFFTPSLSLI